MGPREDRQIDHSIRYTDEELDEHYNREPGETAERREEGCPPDQREDD